MESQHSDTGDDAKVLKLFLLKVSILVFLECYKKNARVLLFSLKDGSLFGSWVWQWKVQTVQCQHPSKSSMTALEAWWSNGKEMATCVGSHFTMGCIDWKELTGVHSGQQSFLRAVLP